MNTHHSTGFNHHPTRSVIGLVLMLLSGITSASLAAEDSRYVAAERLVHDIQQQRGGSVVLFEEDFSNGIPAGWSNVDTSGNNALWSWCDDPSAGQGGGSAGGCPPLWDDALNDQGPFASLTADNGFVTMDSDAAGNISHVSQFTTPPLDLRMAEDVTALMFDGHIGIFTVDAATSAQVRISTDDFATSTVFLPYPDLVTGSPMPPNVRWSFNPTTTVFNISDVVNGQENVRIQWQFAGNFEFLWSIDDVVVLTLGDTVFEDSFEGL